MRFSYVLLAAVIAMSSYTRCWPPSVKQGVVVCQSQVCDVIVYVDEHCNLTDIHGSPVTVIDARVGTHICFYNHSNCALTLKFRSELFGQGRTRISVEDDECVNVTVNQEAAHDEWPFEIFCNCGDGTGHGHTNPTVRVGGDNGGDNGGDDDDG